MGKYPFCHTTPLQKRARGRLAGCVVHVIQRALTRRERLRGGEDRIRKIRMGRRRGMRGCTERRRRRSANVSFVAQQRYVGGGVARCCACQVQCRRVRGCVEPVCGAEQCNRVGRRDGERQRLHLRQNVSMRLAAVSTCRRTRRFMKGFAMSSSDRVGVDAMTLGCGGPAEV